MRRVFLVAAAAVLFAGCGHDFDVEKALTITDVHTGWYDAGIQDGKNKLVPSIALKLPSVIALRQFVRPNEYPAFTRFNLFLRDRFRCVYCGSPKELTFDHVIPRAQGGRTMWENVATACAPCNLRKGGRRPNEAHMHIQREPIRPTSWQLQEHGRAFPPNYLHESWRDYLYWDVELLP